MSGPNVLTATSPTAAQAVEAITAARSKPIERYLIIQPTSGWATLHLSELWGFRDLLFSLASRDLKLRYKQTALGVTWVILQPLMGAGIFALVFGVIAGLSTNGIHYFVYAFAGLLGWNLFNNTVTKASVCLVGNSQLISKVFFPRLVLPLSTVLSSLVDFGVSAAMMVLLMVIYRITPHWSMLLLPLWILMLVVLSTGVGFFTSALTVNFRDVPFIVPVMLQMLFYGSPVVYGLKEALHKMPPTLHVAYMLNPLSSLMEAFRWSIFGKGDIHPGYLIYSCIISVVIFVFGAYSFRVMERKFADVI